MSNEEMPALPMEIGRYKMVPSLSRMHELFHEYARTYAARRVADERDGCAKACEDWSKKEHEANWTAPCDYSIAASACASVIRARSKP